MGTELVTLQHCMLLFGEVISDLRHITMEFSDWMVNNHPPWAVYRTHMYISLVGLNKHPVVQHVGVGKTWKRIMAKCVMKVAGHEAKETCRTDQLCGGIKGVYKGSPIICASCVRENAQKEDWVLLLINTQNVFSVENRTEMLWAV